MVLLGDVVGGSGRRAALAAVPALRAAGAALVVANGENASGGLGLAAKEAREMLAGGIDVLTTGNHVWKHKDLLPVLESEPRILRPANYPDGTPGRGHVLAPLPDGGEVLVACLIGRTFMGHSECPFRAADALLAALPSPHPPVLVDFHAEATAEKLAMRFHLDGRVSVLFGTHTHVQTSDAGVTDAGTGYVTDLGMCGSERSVIGFEPDPVVRRFLTLRPFRYKPRKGRGVVEGVVADVDRSTGRCLAMVAIRVQ